MTETTERKKPMTDRIALVTGAAGAFGQVISRRLAEDGVRVVVADLDAVGAERVASALKDDFGVGAAMSAHVDLASVESLRAMVGTVEENFGLVSILVNNAALNRRASIEQLAEDGWGAMSDVNLRAPAFLAQAIRPHWARLGGGSVVNMASRSWVSGGPIAYTTMKAGIVGMTRSLAIELAPLGVTANAVAPSFIHSNFTAFGRAQEEMDDIARRYIDITPLRRLPEARDIANAVSFLASDQASFITGEVVHVCGGAQLAPLP